MLYQSEWITMIADGFNRLVRVHAVMQCSQHDSLECIVIISSYGLNFGNVFKLVSGFLINVWMPASWEYYSVRSMCWIQIVECHPDSWSLQCYNHWNQCIHVIPHCIMIIIHAYCWYLRLTVSHSINHYWHYLSCFQWGHGMMMIIQ